MAVPHGCTNRTKGIAGMDESDTGTVNAAKTFAVAVRSLREAAGMTQRELAERVRELGTPADATSISRIESGARDLQLSDAGIVSAALGSTLGEMLGGGPDGDELVRLRAFRRQVEQSVSELPRRG